MRAVMVLAALTCAASGSPMAAQSFQQGEAGVSYGETDIDGLDNDLQATGVHGILDFGVPGRGGLQVGANYSNLGLDDPAVGDVDADTTTVDAHLYGNLTPDFRAGVFVGYTNVGEVDVAGVGSFDADTSVLSYGAEFLAAQGPLSYHAYLGIADIEDVEEVDTLLYGLGADYDFTRSFELMANYDGVGVSDSASDTEADLSSFSIGVNYYLAPQTQVPVRLTAGVSRQSIDVEGGGSEDTTSFGVGATFLFGGASLGADRRNLFDSVNLPF